MAEWMTAEQVAVRYVVGEQRLLEYGQRGNLAMRRCADGRVLFHAEGVARFFRARGAAAPAAGNVAGARHLGVLGSARLGEVMAAPMTPTGTPASGGRNARKKPLRSTPEPLPLRTPSAKAG
ncbi:uncharacterized protein SOCEGT47_038220 [Sorangium cellulosum]|uniref:Helix-turn-helix domain-containing protein n=1 Tax=Sorangium cellulosum TaxID=56 RepID=A0A4P2Q223_SORCE|nr:hypothetical protein [Sorangium cellulosum]AUX23299.1 uncharacterized protein SOCEGT47_038220 [Sorangium cellulosum]